MVRGFSGLGLHTDHAGALNCRLPLNFYLGVGMGDQFMGCVPRFFLGVSDHQVGVNAKHRLASASGKMLFQSGQTLGCFFNRLNPSQVNVGLASRQAHCPFRDSSQVKLRAAILG